MIDSLIRKMGHQPRSFDKVEVLSCGSIIQLGSCNERVYLLKIGANSGAKLPGELISVARSHSYGKVFAKVPYNLLNYFLEAGFEKEAVVPNLYNAKEDGFFLGYYVNADRRVLRNENLLESYRIVAQSKKGSELISLSDQYTLHCCTASDITEMAEIYSDVFPTYPFPIHDPSYLLETMNTNVDYFCVRDQDKIVALSSAEIDTVNSNVEMTDFATPKKWRGNGFALHLLALMDSELKQKEIKTAYTIARAASPGMNITFAKRGYTYSGRLINNTNISGQIESMNIWHKSLVD